MRRKTPPAPAHLSAEASAWWEEVQQTFDLEPHHTRLLQAACEAWDRLQNARAAIDEHGAVYEDRFGAPRARPEVAIERDSRIAFARLCRELDLDGDVVPSPRPPAIRSNRG